MHQFVRYRPYLIKLYLIGQPFSPREGGIINDTAKGSFKHHQIFNDVWCHRQCHQSLSITSFFIIIVICRHHHPNFFITFSIILNDGLLYHFSLIFSKMPPLYLVKATDCTMAKWLAKLLWPT